MIVYMYAPIIRTSIMFKRLVITIIKISLNPLGIKSHKSICTCVSLFKFYLGATFPNK